MDQNKNSCKTSIFLASIENPNVHLTNLNVIKPKSTIHKESLNVELDEEYFFYISELDFVKYNFYLKIKKISISIPLYSNSKKINPYIQIEKLKQENIRLYLKEIKKHGLEHLPIDLIFKYTEQKITADTHVFESNSFIKIPMGSDVEMILPFVPQNSKIKFFMSYEYCRELKQNDTVESVEEKQKISRKKIKNKLFKIADIIEFLTENKLDIPENEFYKKMKNLNKKTLNLIDKINDGNKNLS